MFFALIFITIITLTNSVPVYHNLHDLINKEVLLSTTNSTIRSTTTSTTVAHRIEKISRMKDTIDAATDYIRHLLPSILAFSSVIFSIICFYFRKCLLNGGHCKGAWFYPKSRELYKRRQEIKRNQKIILNQLVNQSNPVYTIV
ncbi:unnamed protein product [Adineta ricciae]|uniref:Uncharacterized protein n=1 Tax=Adineta ricciae TaxID=249248 RepID=A0A815VDT8_ADIRI|nr:unnamed protein product [Adineta ricciae]